MDPRVLALLGALLTTPFCGRTDFTTLTIITCPIGHAQGVDPFNLPQEQEKPQPKGQNAPASKGQEYTYK